MEDENEMLNPTDGRANEKPAERRPGTAIYGTALAPSPHKLAFDSESDAETWERDERDRTPEQFR